MVTAAALLCHAVVASSTNRGKGEEQSDPIVRNLRFISMDEMKQGYNGHLTWAAKLKRIKNFANRVKIVKMS